MEKYSKTPKFSNPFEFDMLMLEPVHQMMMNGILVDQAEKKRLQDKAVEEWYTEQVILDKCVCLSDGNGGVRRFNVASTKQVPWLLYHDLGLPKKWKTDRKTKKKTLRGDEAALRDLMAYCKNKVDTLKTPSAQLKYMEGYIICRQILNIRERRKEISSFLGLHIEKGKLAGPSPFEDDDGRMRSSVSVGGTKTSRFAHSKTLWVTPKVLMEFGSQKTKSGKAKKGSNFDKLKCGINMATNPDHLKSMYVADDGYEMAEFDLNRGESWIYAHLSEDPELLRIHCEGLDFHSETAAAISAAFDSQPRSVDWVIANKNGAAYKLRYLGKRVNHASAYRMRAFKGAEVVNKEADDTGVTVTSSQYDVAHKIWLAKYWMVPNWWKEIEETIAQTRTMVTPYGRQLTFHDRPGDALYREATAYVPQSTSVDYINRGFLRVHHEFVRTGAWGLQILAQTHDSILVQYKANHRDEAVPAIANALGDHTLTIKGRTFRIPIEASVGPNWGNLDGYKLGS